MINRKVLLEKMQQFGIDWIGSQGFLDEGQVKHVLDIVENESGLTPRALDEASWDCSNCENRQIGACFEACPNCDTPRQ